MTRHRRPRRLLLGGLPAAWLLIAVGSGTTAAQIAPRPLVAAPRPRSTAPPASERPAPIAPPGPVDHLRATIAANPVTSPYPIAVFERGGRAVVRGVVGTKTIYDAAIRTAIASGVPFDDELTIDTLAAHDVAARGAMAAAMAPGAMPPAYFGPTYGATGGYPPPTYMPFGAVPGGPPGLVYPPPLFGVVDEPFFGFEPPVISYPPYWGALSARRLAETAAAFGPGVGGGAVPPPSGPEPPPGSVDVEIDPNGVAVLRGVVPTLADRIAVGQSLASTPGVREVVNLLRVDPNLATSDGARAEPPPADRVEPIDPRRPGAPPDAAPPPPPDPEPPPEIAPPADHPQPPADVPGLAGLPVRVSLQDGRATLEGEVPSALEAMAATLAVKRHPGVREVVDRLRFTVPIEPKANPLRTAADPADVEEYLGDQIRRQLDGLAEVDAVRLQGDRLEVRGRLVDPDDRRRAEATLRSTPVLRGFSLAMHFAPGP